MNYMASSSQYCNNIGFQNYLHETSLTLFWLELKSVLMKHFFAESRAIDFAIMLLINFFEKSSLIGLF